MQLLNIATTSIALFAILYIAVGLAAHLFYRWQHPTVQPIAAESLDVEELKLLEIIDPCDLLLLLLPPAAESHPWELALEKMPAIEPIAAVHQPAAKVEPPADALDTDALLEAIDIPAPSEFAQMTIRELKRIASDRRIPGYSKKTKSELIELLSI